MGFPYLFESRAKALDLSDRRRIDGLSARNALSRETRVDWIRGEADPMLWSPDILLGAVGDVHAHHAALCLAATLLWATEQRDNTS